MWDEIRSIKAKVSILKGITQARKQEEDTIKPYLTDDVVYYQIETSPPQEKKMKKFTSK